MRRHKHASWRRLGTGICRGHERSVGAHARFGTPILAGVTRLGPIPEISSLLAERGSRHRWRSHPLDECPNTAPGAIVNEDGCSLDQLVPSSGPRSAGLWRNHGAYVAAFAKVAEHFVEEGLLSEE